MPPPGHESLLRAVCADPEDDTVRLVYADWLDEHGDHARAEFIRLQVAVPTRPAAFDPHFARAEELRKLHGRRWRAELPTVHHVTYGQFRRGFIDGISFQNFRVYVEQGPTLLALTPACDVRLFQLHARDIETFFAGPLARRLTVLKANVGIAGEEFVERLASVEWAWRLQQLEITAWGPNNVHPFRPRPTITDRAALGLLRTATLPHLRSLWLSGADLSADVRDEFMRRYGRAFGATAQTVR